MRLVTRGATGRHLHGNRQAVLGATLAVLALTAAACGGGGSKKATLTPGPSTTATAPSSSAPPSATATASAEQDVRTTYAGFTAAASKAKTVAPEQIRPLLAQYVKAGPYLEFLVRSNLLAQQEGRIPWGSGVVSHITKIDIAGTTATVNDCSDDSHAGLADKKTGKVIASTVGGANDNTVAKLERGGDGRWLITEVRSFTAHCSR